MQIPRGIVPAVAAPTFEYVYLCEQKTSGDGGNINSGSWVTRILNTVAVDIGGFCTLTNNQFTLDPGTYIVNAIAPSYATQNCNSRLYNVTDSVEVLPGSGNGNGTTQGEEIHSYLIGRFTIGVNKALEFQMKVFATNAQGLGIGGNFTTETFAQVELWKVG